MKISYNRLWKLLIDRGMRPHDLMVAVGLAPNTLTKLRRNREVAMGVMMRICCFLGVNIGDVMEFVEVDE